MGWTGEGHSVQLHLIRGRRLDRRAKFRTQRQPLGPTDEVLVSPPSMTKSCPFTKAAPSLARKAAALAMSIVSPARGIGCRRPKMPRTTSVTLSAFDPSRPAFLPKDSRDNPAQRNRIHADPLLAQLCRSRPGDRQDSSFGGRIGISGETAARRLKQMRRSAKPMTNLRLLQEVCPPCFNPPSMNSTIGRARQHGATRRASTSVAGPKRCEQRWRWPSSGRREPRAACRG